MNLFQSVTTALQPRHWPEISLQLHLMKMLAFVGVFWYTVGLEEKHGNEIVIDTPLSEQGIAGLDVELEL